MKRKKLVVLLAALLIAVSALAGCGQPAGPPPGWEDLPPTEGLAFAQVGDAFIVTGIGTAETDYVVIPSQHLGLPVTGIENWAFYHTSLISVYIPDSVLSIGDYAFRDCSSLTAVSIPDSVTYIGNYAFYDCPSLSSVSIPNSVTAIGSSAFEGCNNLPFSEYDNALYLGNPDNPYVALFKVKSPDITGCEIHPSAKIICSHAFESCFALTSVSIPDSVTYIGSYAFYDCSALTSVSIPDSVTEIGDYAFEGCTALTAISIPDSVTEIGNFAFYNCSALASVSIPDSVTSIGSSAFGGRNNLQFSEYDNALYLGNSANPYVVLFKAKSPDITGCEIHPSAKIICYSAFSDCTALTSILIPDSVISIGPYAFHDCTSLTSVSIPDSVTKIGYGAFSGCSSLTSVSIPDSVTEIGYYAFSNCTALTYVSIPDSVTSIGGAAFSYCSALASVSIPDSVIEISYFAFSECHSLTSVFYGGTAEQWEKFDIDSFNSELKNADLYLYSEDEPAEGNDETGYDGKYWRYAEDGVTPVIWKKEG